MKHIAWIGFTGGAEIAKMKHICEGVSESAPNVTFSCKRTFKFDNLKNTIYDFKHGDQYVCELENIILTFLYRLFTWQKWTDKQY